MRSRTVQMYYCDFCSKKGQRRHIIEQHEKHCTGNPDRECRMCLMTERSNGLSPRDGVKLIEEIGSTPMYEDGPCVVKADISRLREATRNCPACVLAAIRLHQGKLGEDYGVYDFDFKKERDRFWKELEPEGE